MQLRQIWICSKGFSLMSVSKLKEKYKTPETICKITYTYVYLYIENNS